jgi:hypothetical protein
MIPSLMTAVGVGSGVFKFISPGDERDVRTTRLEGSTKCSRTSAALPLRIVDSPNAATADCASGCHSPMITARGASYKTPERRALLEIPSSRLVEIYGRGKGRRQHAREAHGAGCQPDCVTAHHRATGALNTA